MAAAAARAGKKAAKRGNSLPWARPGHNGLHPEATEPTTAARRVISGRPQKSVVAR